MAVTTTKTNKPINPRGNDQSPKGYNRAALYSGKALDFDGVNDSINCGDFDGASFGNGTTDTPCSIVSYFYLDNADRARVLGKHTEWVFGTNNLNEFNFSILDGTGTSNQIRRAGISALPFVGKWVHMVATYDGSSSSSGINVYINGVLSNGLAEDVGSYVATQNTSANVYVGLWSVDSRYLNGKVSGTKIFNTALTAAQVSDLYNNPEKIVPTGVDNTALKLWLPMMEGAGTTAYDGSGGGNHGTISGATWTHGIGTPVAQTAVIDWNKGTNKSQYSEQFENAYWGLVDTETPTANDTTAPDGQTTADKIVPSANNNIHYIWNTTISLTGQNTISVFAKYNGYNIGIRPQGIGSGQAFANFDLQNGTILGSGGTSYDDSSITSFGDGWYRISMTMDNASTYGINFYAVNGTTATELPTFTADGTSGYYLWGAQVNAGATLTPYVRTGATAQTSDVLLPQGLTTGRDITGVNLFENVRKQGALNLDGNSWAEVHDNASLDFSSGMTMECWVQIDYLDSFQHILGKWNFPSQREFMIYYNVSTQAVNFNFGHNAAAEYASFPITANGQWFHLVGTTDGTTITPYVNGVAGTTAAVVTALEANTLPVTIGTDYNKSVNQFVDKQIAQPRIYNRALTAEEVQRNYDAGKNIYS